MPSISVSITESCTPASPVTCIVRVSALIVIDFWLLSIALRNSLIKVVFIFLFLLFFSSSLGSSSSSSGSSLSYCANFSSRALSSSFFSSISSLNALNSLSSSSVISRTSALQVSTIAFIRSEISSIRVLISTEFIYY